METAPANFAMHQGTTERQWGFVESVEGYARHGIRALTVRRSSIEEYGVTKAAKLISDADLKVLGVSRCASLTEDDPAKIAKNHDENIRAIALSAELQATNLAMISSGLPADSKDLAGARSRARDAVAKLLPEARAAGVSLALEAIHPMRAASGCVWSTLGQANKVCEELGDGTGLIVDAYHVWWDPDLTASIEAAKGRIVSFQISDWLRDTTAADGSDRGMPGDGVIPLREMGAQVRQAGFDGYDELELFSERNWWQRDPDELIDVAIARHREIFGDD
ncbi:MAG: sugar phosphate isomerase/epimerase [Rhodospirillaceae bacterium]|jgi:sugar phosphate isomerase/epimerase|nr:sugar phosphate isomerase/epimerase [Rhodospirillaceae bacterium]MBT7361941.1 sugar phosphate isomerase/epimerase [Rhodospirillaceae bacterium]